MTTGTRTTMVSLGLLAALALPACAGNTPGGYGNAGNAPASAAPNPVAEEQKAPDPVAEAPVGIPTEKLVGVAIPRMGKVVTDAKGWILYRFDKDTANPPATNCSGDCAKVWPPVLTDGSPELSGITANLVGTVTRDDGSNQVTLGGWPLYRYVGDTKVGQWKGQGVGGVWFVAAPTGKKNLSCLPTSPPSPASPPTATGAPGGGY